MLQIKKISIGSAFNVGLIFAALYWGIFGIFFALSPSIGNPEPSLFEPEPPTFGEAFLTYLIGLPLFAILGGLGAAIGALLYNLAAKWTGGVKLEISQVNDADQFMTTRNLTVTQTPSPTTATSDNADIREMSEAGYPPVGGRTENMAMLQQASRLIKDQQYQTAYDLLLTMPDLPTAQKWLGKLRELDPTLTANRDSTYRSGDVDDWSPVNFD